jgi:glycosyltransferase involved in cell wall biosynthesis
MWFGPTRRFSTPWLAERVWAEMDSIGTLKGVQRGAKVHSLIALLGTRDSPTDGVQDYCEFLSRALDRRGVGMVIARVDWKIKGWSTSLRELWNSSKAWRGNWVVLQYTALGWSRRGFPFGVVAVLAILRCRGVRCGVLFHEPHQTGGTGWLGRVRGTCQSWVIRRSYNLASKAIFADPLEMIRWLPVDDSKSTFIPIGANVPERVSPAAIRPNEGCPKTVAIYCVTGAPHASIEIEEIAYTARSAVSSGVPLRFIFFGRGTSEARKQIQCAFRDIPVEVSVLGLLDANEIGGILADSDVMLCVRGAIFPRRGSALAGISCGLPIVCYRGPESTFPITEAGLELVPYRDRDALGKAVCRVLSDDRLRQELRRRSFQAHDNYFSWDSIAARFARELFNE